MGCIFFFLSSLCQTHQLTFNTLVRSRNRCGLTLPMNYGHLYSHVLYRMLPCCKWRDTFVKGTALHMYQLLLNRDQLHTTPHRTTNTTDTSIFWLSSTQKLFLSLWCFILVDVCNGCIASKGASLCNILLSRSTSHLLKVARCNSVTAPAAFFFLGASLLLCTFQPLSGSDMQ